MTRVSPLMLWSSTNDVGLRNWALVAYSLRLSFHEEIWYKAIHFPSTSLVGQDVHTFDRIVHKNHSGANYSIDIWSTPYQERMARMVMLRLKGISLYPTATVEFGERLCDWMTGSVFDDIDDHLK